MADAIYVKTSPRVLIRRGPPGPAGPQGETGPAGSSGSGTIDSTTNLIAGDGAGAGVDSTIDPADVTTLLANTSGTNTGDQTTVSGAAGSAAALSVSGQTGLFTVTGLTSTDRAKVVRDAADTILELGGSYTPTGTWTSLTMATPVLGTPTSGNLANCTGTASSLTAGHATDATALSIAGQTGLMTVTGLTSTNRAKTVRDAADTILELGGSYSPTGTWTSLTMATPVLGTPTSGNLANCTGTAASLTAGHATDAAALTVAGQTGKVTITGLTSTDRIKTVRNAADTLLELGGSYTPTGTWTSMTFVTPTLGQPVSGDLSNCTGFPAGSAPDISDVTGLGTGVETALGINVGTSGAPVVQNGALGTPSSGNLSSCTFPTLNQNTSGSAASLSVSGQTGLFTVTGLASTSRVKTVRDAADTLLELGGSYTPTGTWTSLTMVTPVLGTPSSGNLASCTFPTLNQNTTGSAASLSVSGQTGKVTVTGLASTDRAKTVRDAADTILELGGSYTPTGTWTSLTLVTPALGTPTAGVLTSCTGTASGLTAGHATDATALSVSGQTGLMTVTGLTSTNRAKTVRDAADTILELGGNYTPTGTWTSLTMVTPVLGTPASGNLVNCLIGGVAIPTISSTSTFTNKRITKRVGTTASSATPSIDSDAYDEYTITALAVAITSLTITGSPTEGQSLILRILDNNTVRAIAFGTTTQVASTDLPFPTTTVQNKYLYCTFIYNDVLTKWVMTGKLTNI